MNSVPIESLRRIWPSVRPMFEKLAAVRNTWTAEDIYKEIECGHARLFVGNESVLVTVPQFEEYTKQKILHVWCGISESDDYENGLKWLKQHAREFGFDKITFQSPRKGWEKRFPIETVIYRIDI